MRTSGQLWIGDDGFENKEAPASDANISLAGAPQTILGISMPLVGVLDCTYLLSVPCQQPLSFELVSPCTNNRDLCTPHQLSRKTREEQCGAKLKHPISDLFHNGLRDIQLYT